MFILSLSADDTKHGIGGVGGWVGGGTAAASGGGLHLREFEVGIKQTMWITSAVRGVSRNASPCAFNYAI